MIKYSEFEQMKPSKDICENISTAALIEVLRNRTGVAIDFIDYGDQLQLTTHGPKVVLTISVDDEEEVKRHDDCFCRNCVNKGCIGSKCESDSCEKDTSCYVKDEDQCPEYKTA